MKKKNNVRKLFNVLFFVAWSFVFATFAIADGLVTPEATPSLLDSLSAFLSEDILLWVTGTATVAAALATVLPKVTDDSSTVYKWFYHIIQFLGYNFGKASNAQDKKI